MGDDDGGARVDGYGADRDVEGLGFAVGDLEGKTAVEVKTTLITRALEETGMGRYQWCMCVVSSPLQPALKADGARRFFLCGFGYALDLMWAQAFSLVTPRIQQELGVPDEQYGDIFSGASLALLLVCLFSRGEPRAASLYASSPQFEEPSLAQRI